MAKKNTAKESTESVEYNKYEKARMVGSRALQLSMGAPLLLKLAMKDLEKLKYNPIQIAIKEYNEGVIPITVKRPVPGA